MAEIESAAKFSSDLLNVHLNRGVHMSGQDYLDALAAVEARDAAIRAATKFEGWLAGVEWQHLKMRIGSARALGQQCQQDISECELLRKRPRPAHLSGADLDKRIAQYRAREEAFAREVALLEQQANALEAKYAPTSKEVSGG